MNLFDALSAALAGGGVLLGAWQAVDAIVHRRPTPPGKPGRAKGRYRRVRGRIRALDRVSAPLSGKPCVVAWSVIFGRGRSTATDFLLESDEGSFIVRTEGLTLMNPSVLVWPCVPRHLSPELASERDSLGISPDSILESGEETFEDGDEIEIAGLCHDELAPAVMGGGYRAKPRRIPALHGGGGRLELWSCRPRQQ